MTGSRGAWPHGVGNRHKVCDRAAARQGEAMPFLRIRVDAGLVAVRIDWVRRARRRLKEMVI